MQSNESYRPGEAIKKLRRTQKLIRLKMPIKTIDKVSKQSTLVDEPEDNFSYDKYENSQEYLKTPESNLKKINIASMVNINSKHIFQWDIDKNFSDYWYEIIEKLVKKHYLDLFVLKTPHGFHLVDFHLFDIKKLDEIQKEFQAKIHTDYLTIIEVMVLDEKENQRFLGTTLRINEPCPKLINRISMPGIKRSYSKGHMDAYKHILQQDFEIEGKALDTEITHCSYLGIA